MGGRKKKLYEELSEAFPDFFPDNEPEQVALQQRALLLRIDETLDPDNPALIDQRASLMYEIQESIKPPVLVGAESQLKAIRDNYVNNKIAMELEGLRIDDNTPSLNFWQYYKALDARYKPKIPNVPTE